MWKVVALFLMLSAPFSWGGVIVLKDGTRVEGDLKRTTDGWTITTADGAVQTVASDAIKSIELGSAPTTRSSLAVSESLASLRRSTEALSNLDEIIERYQRLISTIKDEKTLAEAKADLAGWEQRKAQKLVKHGNRWVSPSEIAALSAQSTSVAESARELLRQNKTQEADQLLTQALATDPRNAAAQYLRGVSFFRQDKFIEARKAFETVNSVAPNHPPTLNNLAVIAWRQKQVPAALNFYDQAMQSAGVNEYILNNVAEALGTMPDPGRRGTPVEKAMRHFIELDRTLQQQRAQEGYYRWGGTWINQKRMDELKAEEKAVRDKLLTMQADYDQVRQRIADIDTQIAQLQALMNEIAGRYQGGRFRDQDGRVIVVPLPDSYYETQRDAQRLAIERDSLAARLDLMQQQVQNVQRQVPVPQFTGIQQIVGVEGMPTSKDLPMTPTAPAIPVAP